MTTVSADRARLRERLESLFPNGVEHGFTTSEDGTGFGLSIAETICRAHGWDIRLDGGEGGAGFEITGVGPAEHSYPLAEELIGGIVADRRIRPTDTDRVAWSGNQKIRITTITPISPRRSDGTSD